MNSEVVKSAIKLARSKIQRGMRQLLRVAERGDARYCPCCESSLRRFEPFGVVPRSDARCGVCGALERHRAMHLFFRRHSDLFDGRPKKLLHVAPEPQLERLFRKAQQIDYLSADLFDVGAMVRMDITDIHVPDESFDVIYCSHVLEHVPDDRKAMQELHRILKPGGWAILQVPITAEVTFEDPSVTDPKERERLFGQVDHVRCYGPDFANRLNWAGFDVEVIDFIRCLEPAEVRKFGLRTDDLIFRCSK